MKAKKVIVTGAAQGIGLEIARHCRDRGADVCCWDIRPPDEQESLGYFRTDVSSEEQVHAAYAEFKKTFGTPDILVNNSGLQYMAPIDDFPLEQWNKLIGVMLTGTFLVSRSVIPAMKQARSGRIINISSMHGKLGSPFKSAYISAKHGVLGLTKVMALELAEFGITANAICPGFVETPLVEQQIQKQMELNNMSRSEVARDIFLGKQCIKQFTTGQQIAQMVEFLASDAASAMTGEAISMAGGWGIS